MECVNVTPNEELTADQLLHIKKTLAPYVIVEVDGVLTPVAPADLTDAQIQTAVCTVLCNMSTARQKKEARDNASVVSLS